jgi:hypothetical protein
MFSLEYGPRDVVLLDGAYMHAVTLLQGLRGLAGQRSHAEHTRFSLIYLLLFFSNVDLFVLLCVYTCTLTIAEGFSVVFIQNKTNKTHAEAHPQARHQRGGDTCTHNETRGAQHDW